MNLKKADLWALGVPILMVGGLMSLLALVEASNLIGLWFSRHPLLAIAIVVAASYGFARFVKWAWQS